jgi:hypothetical protein
MASRLDRSVERFVRAATAAPRESSHFPVVEYWRTPFHQDTDVTPPTLPEPRLTTGFEAWLFRVLGLAFVGLAYLGAVLPVLPTTPFLLLASACFARSSPRLHRWLRRTPYFGHLIRDWETHRGIRPGVKATAVLMVTLVVGGTILFSGAPEWAKWSAGGLAVIGIATILFAVPTVRR